jgi:hypothetical protein
MGILLVAVVVLGQWVERLLQTKLAGLAASVLRIPLRHLACITLAVVAVVCITPKLLGGLAEREAAAQVVTVVLMAEQAQ